MALVAQIFAVLAAIAHLAVFVIESFLFDRRPVQQMLSRQSEPSPGVRLWAFNQGFYNLFVAAGAIIGVIVWAAGDDTVGRTLVIYTCAFMTAAGVVLFVSDRRLWKGMLAQSIPPLIGLVAALAA